MVSSPPKRVANHKSPYRKKYFGNKAERKPSVRLFLEELEARAVPSITASGMTITPAEGIPFNGVVATFTDSDANATVGNFTTSIAWGDGTISAGTVQAHNSGFQVIGSHTYADEGIQSVAVTIKDVDGSSATAASTAQVADNDALTATGYNVTPTEGQAFNGIVATFSDVTYAGNSTGDFTATINWGDGTTSGGTISSQAGLFVVRGTHTFAEEGSESIAVTIREDVEGVAGVTTTSTATIGDAPLVVIGTGFNATEGLSNSVQVAVLTDANSDAQFVDFTIGSGQMRIDWGDGTGLDYGFFLSSEGGNNPIRIGGTHTYAEAGSYTVTVTINDRGGSQATGTTTATIADGTLTPTSTPVNAVLGIAFSGELARITDANPDATLNDFAQASGLSHPSLLIDWGDGATSGGMISQPDGFGYYFEVSGNHTYSAAGSFIIKATVTDIDGSTTTATTTATVTDPTEIVGRVSGTGELWTGVSTGSSFIASLWGAFDPSRTWVNMISGDFTGDGRTDVAARDLATGQWWVAVSTGSSFTVTQWTTWNPNVTWADVKVGDFTGDGKADIAGRVLQTGEWWVAESTGSSFTNSLWTAWNRNVTWVDVQVGDFNGDGKADIAGRVLETGEWWVGQSTGSSFSNTFWARWNPNVTWVDVMVGDFNGDGKADIVGRVRETGEWWVGSSTGSNFNSSLWTTWSTAVTWVDVHVGDFNGDGRDDIVGRALETGQWWVTLSPGPVCFACGMPTKVGQTLLFATWSTAVTWVDVQVGDFNGDGKADITGRALEYGQWWTGMSTGSSFDTSLWSTWSTAVSWSGVRAGDFA